MRLKDDNYLISYISYLKSNQMTFEEFFKKKKINLQTFEQGEPALFFEFKTHYEQMGEKSFDHTKKYWFNKLRLRFPAPVEVKTEKVVIENSLAEQTITESLIESASPIPNVGFKPKFRAGVTKPTEPAFPSTEDAEPAITPQLSEENTEPAVVPPNIGFKPKFRAGITKPAETASSSTEDAKPAITPPLPAENAEQAPSQLGFKPKFKAGITKPAETASPSTEDAKTAATPQPPAENSEEAASVPPNIGFKPKFRAGITKPAEPAIEQKDKPEADETPKQSIDDKEVKPAYKPRFNIKNIKPKEEE